MNKSKPDHFVGYFDQKRTQKKYEFWAINDIYHIINDKYHREDGPAYISYYINGNVRQKIYYINGKRHREDGPAYIYYYKNVNICREEYWLNGESYSKEEYLRLTSPQNKIKALLHEQK